MKLAKKPQILALFVLIFLGGVKQASASSNYTKDYNDLFLLVTIVSFIVAALVIGLWIYFIIQFKEGTETERIPLSHENSKKLEMGWTGIATAIVLILMIVSYPVLLDIDSQDDIDESQIDHVIVAQGVQWYWNYYLQTPDGDVLLTTANASLGSEYLITRQNDNGFLISTSRLTLQVDLVYKLILFSQDVLHAFYVPDFHIKEDVVPGVNNTIVFTPTEIGSYPIYCAEYCGTAHSGMRGIVEVIA